LITETRDDMIKLKKIFNVESLLLAEEGFLIYL
jgi:hypothetical protein